MTSQQDTAARLAAAGHSADDILKMLAVPPVSPQPGDFAVTDISGLGGKLIGAMERIAYSHATPWEHAFIYVGDGRIVQAEPGGAQNVPLGRYDRILWSTGLLEPTDEQRARICASALHYAADKVGYSYADYLAIAAHRAHLWMPGLREYIASTGHMICSQLADQCWHDAGYQLFDKRWAGYVTPYDLGALLADIMFRTGKFAR